MIERESLSETEIPPLTTKEKVVWWCALRFGAGFEITLEPSKPQKEAENSGKGHFLFLRQTLACTNWEALNGHFANNHFCFLGTGGVPFGGFALKWSLLATSLEGFSVTSHENKGY